MYSMENNTNTEGLSSKLIVTYRESASFAGTWWRNNQIVVPCEFKYSLPALYLLWRSSYHTMPGKMLKLAYMQWRLRYRWKIKCYFVIVKPITFLSCLILGSQAQENFFPTVCVKQSVSAKRKARYKAGQKSWVFFWKYSETSFLRSAQSFRLWYCFSEMASNTKNKTKKQNKTEQPHRYRKQMIKRGAKQWRG